MAHIIIQSFNDIVALGNLIKHIRHWNKILGKTQEKSSGTKLFTEYSFITNF